MMEVRPMRKLLVVQDRMNASVGSEENDVNGSNPKNSPGQNSRDGILKTINKMWGHMTIRKDEVGRIAIVELQN